MNTGLLPSRWKIPILFPAVGLLYDRLSVPGIAGVPPVTRPRMAALHRIFGREGSSTLMQHVIEPVAVHLKSAAGYSD